MQTNIHPSLIDQPKIQEADDILRKCVHCGFCNATCPTYQLLGDELDGPRGRIYLIKNLLENDDTDESSVAHLDRCLTCRACETTCPSGVAYGRLLDIGREVAADKVKRPLYWRLISAALRLVVPRPGIFRPMLQLAQWVRPLMPEVLKRKVPRIIASRHEMKADRSPRALLLSGCVQGVATPNVNRALQLVLNRQGIPSEIVSEGCCGALDYHLSAHEVGVGRMKQIVDQLYPRLDSIDFIVSSATGCGVTIREYPELLKADPAYRDKAQAVVNKLVDPVELVEPVLGPVLDGVRLSVHTPCSMQHGMKMPGVIDSVLASLGATLLPVTDSHLCCGSAGTYSIMQPSLSSKLQANKISALNQAGPDVIVTANVGCQLHLGAASETPVMHWIELIADRL